MASADAQDDRIKMVDTDAMRMSAAKRTGQLDKVVTLSDEQRERVNDFYMSIERRLDAIDQRYTIAGLTPEQKASEMAVIHNAMKKDEEQALPELLTPDQLAKWKAK